MRDFQIGQLVTSTAGRDAGNNYVIIGTDGDIYVWIADGKYRRVEEPKRKNRKHLRAHEAVSTEILERLQAGEKITNSLVRKVLAELVAAAEAAGHLTNDKEAESQCPRKTSSK
ncbi:MAG: RNA-binding protein [Firmicutes bacterium]|nr:RNA-binding protein [Bacillota bacterium]